MMRRKCLEDLGALGPVLGPQQAVDPLSCALTSDNGRISRFIFDNRGTVCEPGPVRVDPLCLG